MKYPLSVYTMYFTQHFTDKAYVMSYSHIGLVEILKKHIVYMVGLRVQ